MVRDILESLRHPENHYLIQGIALFTNSAFMHDIVRADPVSSDDDQEVGMPGESKGVSDFSLVDAFEAPFGNIRSMVELFC